MPDIGNDGLDVSKEEERYLRRAFRRFALPYLVVAAIAVVAALAGVLPGGGSAPAEQPELESLIAEAASLRDALASLRNDLDVQGSRSNDRLAALEGDLGSLRDGVDEAKRLAGSRRPAGSPDAELASRVDHAHQRLNALDRRLEDALAGRLPAVGRTQPTSPQPPAPTPAPVVSDPAPEWPPARSDLP